MTAGTPATGQAANAGDSCERYVIRRRVAASGHVWYMIFDTDTTNPDDHKEIGDTGIDATHFGEDVAYLEIQRRLTEYRASTGKP
jgi:hypothetical protein